MSDSKPEPLLTPIVLPLSLLVFSTRDLHLDFVQVKLEENEDSLLELAQEVFGEYIVFQEY